MTFEGGMGFWFGFGFFFKPLMIEFFCLTYNGIRFFPALYAMKDFFFQNRGCVDKCLI